jgi:hypothetical protein
MVATIDKTIAQSNAYPKPTPASVQAVTVPGPMKAAAIRTPGPLFLNIPSWFFVNIDAKCENKENG